MTLYSVLRFESTVVVMADQNLLDAINVGEKRLLDTTSIDKIPTDISNNKRPFGTDDGDKSQKPIKDSNGVNSISVTLNTETFSQETLNLSTAVIFSPPNLVNANKANPIKVNPFIAVRPRKGDHFSETLNQDDNEHKKSNSDSDKNTSKDRSKNQKNYIVGDTMIKNLKSCKMSKKLKNCNFYWDILQVPRLGVWKTT